VIRPPLFQFNAKLVEALDFKPVVVVAVVVVSGSGSVGSVSAVYMNACTRC